MNWINRPPRRGNYETEEEYLEALGDYQDAAEAYYEEKRYRDLND